MDLLEEQSQQSQPTTAQGTLTPTAGQVQTPQPTTSQLPEAPTQKFSQMKALGWILALLAVIFILLVGVSLVLNLTSRKGERQSSTQAPTQTPITTPAFQQPISTPAPQIPESRFNLTQ